MYLNMIIPVVQSQCSGTVTLNDVSGVITDGYDTYPAGTDCEWLIQPKDSEGNLINDPITVTFTSVDMGSTSSGYFDFVYVFDSASVSWAHGLGAASGSGLTIPPQSYTSTGGSMYIYFRSWGSSIGGSGFRLEYTTTNQCQGVTCANGKKCFNSVDDYSCICPNGNMAANANCAEVNHCF